VARLPAAAGQPGVRRRGLPRDARLHPEPPRRLAAAGRGRAYTLVGVTGLVARAIAFGLIGVVLVKAAVEYDPREAVGLDGALTRLTNHAYGSSLLVIVACGLIAFGIYSLADARFRKI
jgi:Domain of Unknown Function (DUF1206)